MTKTTFRMDQVDDAVYTIFDLKFKDGWTGCLKLETDGKKIYITQYPGSNSWMQGCDTIFMLEDYVTLTDIFEELEFDSDGKIESDSYNTFNPAITKSEYYTKFGQEYTGVFEDAIIFASERLGEIETEKEIIN